MDELKEICRRVLGNNESADVIAELFKALDERLTRLEEAHACHSEHHRTVEYQEIEPKPLIRAGAAQKGSNNGEDRHD